MAIMKRWMIGAACLALVAFGGVALAQDDATVQVQAQTQPTPLQTADSLRDTLFDAQRALLLHDAAAASAAADQAEQIYASSRFAGLLPDLDTALAAARSGDALALATARGGGLDGAAQAQHESGFRGAGIRRYRLGGALAAAARLPSLDPFLASQR